ncbi:pentapeptide repeat protein [[Leptolyngbya] sp. PCC 7376]|nr:pentapeptide repeat-containing protein [[Leptolyngbya] sp. PCC 7376]AFY38606.1 pentapeptide repeat protein [[Leptolyngbya] sp. PCC 7376]
MSQTKPNSFSEMPNDKLPQADQSGEITPAIKPTKIPPPRQDLMERRFYLRQIDSSNPWLVFTAVGVMVIGLLSNWLWLGLSGTLVTLLLSLKIILPSVKEWLSTFLTAQERKTLIGFIAFAIAIAGLFKFLGVYALVGYWLNQIKWDEFGSWADWVGALGQIMIAVLAVYVAWEQYVISRDLTIQQNRITQQQTIDTYFQGISELALNEEGLLEDWPQERSIAEGRTAAILSSVDAGGKAKILRFLSQSRLLTPLRRDGRLGRPIFDGTGGYQEDRLSGVRVIDLGVMLAGTDLHTMDLRWTDLSEANMVRANLQGCDLVRANLARTILVDANLKNADLKGTILFYGSFDAASPRVKNQRPDYRTGEFTGAVVEDVDFTNVKRMSEEQRYYCCSWCGEKARGTIPGGCDGIPNRLNR